MIKPNEGTMDRVIRAIVGIVLIFLALSLTDWLKTVVLIIGIIVLITAAIGWCGLYTVCGWNTMDKKPSGHDDKPASDNQVAEVKTDPEAETTNEEVDMIDEADFKPQSEPEKTEIAEEDTTIEPAEEPTEELIETASVTPEEKQDEEEKI